LSAWYADAAKLNGSLDYQRVPAIGLEESKAFDEVFVSAELVGGKEFVFISLGYPPRRVRDIEGQIFAFLRGDRQSFDESLGS
jgi:hypothetical protein